MTGDNPTSQPCPVCGPVCYCPVDPEIQYVGKVKRGDKLAISEPCTIHVVRQTKRGVKIHVCGASGMTVTCWQATID